MPTNHIIFALFILTAPLAARPAAAMPDRMDCSAGPHDPMRVRRLPGTPATTEKPRNPLEDQRPHCQERDAGVAPDKAEGARPLVPHGRRF